MKAPNKITLPIRIKRGKFASNTNRVSEILGAHEGNIINVTFAKRFNKRSGNQNRYYWGVIVPIFINNIEDMWGELWGSQDVHEFLKQNCNYHDRHNEDTGQVVRTTRSTTDNDTKQQEDFHRKCRELSEEYFSSVIPLPNEDLLIEFD